jgi:hypothetical protein
MRPARCLRRLAIRQCINVKDVAGGTTKVHAVQCSRRGDKVIFMNESGADADIFNAEALDSFSWVDEDGEEGPTLWSKHGDD